MRSTSTCFNQVKELDMSDEHEETEKDCKVDFDFETEAPAICSECGKHFPIRRLDPSDSDPLCPSCKYIDWCDVCGSDCYCNDEDHEE